MPQNDPREIGRAVIRQEAEALAAFAERLGPEFDQAVERLFACTGRVVLCGMGKSGQIAQKIASTLVSTGTLADALHPSEGFHGDIGVVTAKDIVIFVSNSGATQEVVDLLPVVRAIGAPVIALTGPRSSPLARGADVALCWGEIREADPLGLVPSVSSALTLAVGDALTVALMVRRGFTLADYARLHPSGSIGRRLTVRVEHLLRGAETNPTVPTTATFETALATVTKFTLGGVSVVDTTGRLVGIVTDGDVRRVIAASTGSVRDLLQRPVSEVMTKNPTRVGPGTLGYDAVRTMESHKPRPIYLLPVVDDAGKPVGMVHIHTLVQAGLISGKDEE